MQSLPPFRAPVLLQGQRLAGIVGLALLVAALAAAACGSDEPETITLFPDDGVEIEADVWSGDDRWVLLGHQFPDNRRPWDPIADRFIDRGYSVLSWDFRCHGNSGCNETATEDESVRSLAVKNIWRDWHAAIDYAIANGADEIYAIGASMGGTSLMQIAADRDELLVAVAISSPNRFKGLDALANFERVTIPKLFIVGELNMAAPDFSRRFHAEAVGPSRLLVLDTDLHGNPLAISEQFGEEIQDLLVEFVEDPLGTIAAGGSDGKGLAALRRGEPARVQAA